MDNIFLTVLNMSLTGAFVIAAICIARLPLKKAPKIISYCLWAVAGFRLVFPFSIESILSLMPFNAAPIPMDIAMQLVPRIDSGIPFMNNAVSGVLPAPIIGDSVNPLQVWTAIGAYAWIVGAVIMVLYGVVSYFILKQKMRGAVHTEANIYEADNIKSPFVLGVFNPKIYMPIGLSAQERGYILLHEQTHIKRRDHIVKFGAYFILCLHWFNPLAWVAFLLMGVDMELSCDERVLKETGDGVQKDYSRSLLALATGRRIIGGSPLAFGESGVKQRIKNVLNFRKPSRVIILAAVILASVLSVGLALNRTSAISLENDNLYGMRIVYEENPATFFSDMKLIWNESVYHVTPMTGVRRGNRIGIADDEYSTWLVYELRGHDRDFLFIAESRNEDVWRIMSSHPPESPLQQYILENATDRQKMERLLSVTLFLDGTAILATPPISSFMMRQPNFYTFTDGELLIHYENGEMVARFEVLNDSDMIYERTLVFVESSVPLFADVGARYVARYVAQQIPAPVDDTITIYMFKDGSGQVGFSLFNWELTFDPIVLSSSNGYIDVAGLNAALAKYPQDTIRRVFVKHTSDFTKDEVIAITDQFVIPSGNFNMGTGLAEWDGTM
ncbi:MAG: hypothetical protein FWD90_08210 [Defluviitaleaceae bacterium]|nr:hypothetical protein [Defluviitaleaceae bacterium]